MPLVFLLSVDSSGIVIGQFLFDYVTDVQCWTTMNRINTRKAANIVSFGLNAPAVALITFLVLLAGKNTSRFWPDFIVTASFGIILPLLILYYLRKRGVIADFFASNKRGRLIPFVGAIASYVVGTAVLLLVGASPIIIAVMFCYFGNSFVMMVITLKWKISIHTSGITGPATALVYLQGFVWSPFFLLAIPVGWARMKLGAHTLDQVIAGAVLTIATTWLQLEILLNHIFV